MVKCDCYRCGEALTDEDVRYTQNSGWCISCRKDYDIERRLRDKSTDHIVENVKRMKRVLKVYELVLQERRKRCNKS